MVTNKDSELAKMYFLNAVENEKRLKKQDKEISELNIKLSQNALWEYLEVEEVVE